MSAPRLRVAIVGGGIVGAACAYACAKAGLAVTLVEGSPRVGGATAVATGHIVTLAGSPAQLALTAFSRRLWHRLGPQLPDHAGYWEAGTVWVAKDPEEYTALEAVRQDLERGHVGSELWNETRLALEEPGLRSGLSGALYVPNDAVVRPEPAAAALLDWAIEAGASVLHNRTVASVDDGRLRFVDHAELATDRIVVAAGTASAALVRDLPVRPRRGHLLATGAAPGLVRHQLLDAAYLRSTRVDAPSEVVFNIHPRRSGELVLGSSRDYAAEGTAPDANTFDRILQRAVEYVPRLGALPILDRWVGYRPASADGLPYIGPVPDRVGVWVATGHEGLGVTSSLGTGELIAASLLGRPLDIASEPYWPTPQRLRLAGGAS